MYTFENVLQKIGKLTRIVWWFRLWYYLTREYMSYDCTSPSLFSIYYFPNTLCLKVFLKYFDYRHLSIHYYFFRSVFKRLTCCLRSSSLNFDLVHLDFPPDFLKLVFLLQYLSIFWELTLAWGSLYIQASILDAQSKALQSVKSGSQNHQRD